MDQINQVLILLAVICNMVVGLSINHTNFLLLTVTMLVKLGMSTISSTGSHLNASFTPSQTSIIDDMPTSLQDALKQFDVEGSFHLFATCPSCSFTTKGQPLTEKNTFDFPEKCTNCVAGKDGTSECGAQLLKT
ncbi:hypothetical protein L218DRAFT_158660 [Marasmius fiardii PR-910]|nr:hypothetical protein L218DRAFT_158660 [Marasmius fiardii PR-910]